MWGQTPSYVLEADGEVRLGTNSAGKALKINGVGQRVEFEVKKSSTATGGIHIQMSTDGGSSWGRDEYISGSLTTSYKSFGYDIDANVTHIRFKAQGTMYKYYQKVKVIRRTRLVNFNYSTSSSFDMGTIRYGKETSIDITGITYHIASYPMTLTGTCVGDNVTEDGTFSIEDVIPPVSEKGTGTLNIPITFSPKSVGNKSATVTLKFVSNLRDTTTVATFKVIGTGADKGTPAFTWNLTNAYKNHSYSDFFVSTNTETSYSISSSNPSLGAYDPSSGKLVFGDGEGTVRFTVTQEGNVDWNAHSAYFDVNVTEAQNHLPLTITNSNFGTLVRGVSGDCEWNNGGIYLSNNGYNDKTAEFVFEGIPNQISFSFERHNIVATGVKFNLKLSADGNNWDEVWSSSSTSGTETYTFTNEQLNHKYVRLTYSGNFDATFKNVNITELKYLNIDKASLSFNTNTKGNTVTAQTFTVSHCNAGYGVTIASDDENFTVSPSPLETTGGDLMGTETITVRYLNNCVGLHSGTITISDPNGTNPSKTLTVTGTTQTRYYTRAAAATSGGGYAYITYDSGSANSTIDTSTSIVNSGLVTTENASKTVYLRAVPADGYRFKRWQKGGSQVSTTTTCSVSYDYNSESSSNPPTETYTAVFEPKTLILDPTTSPSYEAGKYAGAITLNRNLPAGYSTIALPFATTVVTLTGHEANDNDWVAQLTTVTYNAEDDYTLFFTKSEGGVIAANQPYVLHLGTAVPSPSWMDLTVGAATSMTVTAQAGYGNNVGADGTYASWSMSSNFMAGMSMEGLYGIVNSGENNQGGQGGLKLGGSGSTLSAFSAYITPPTAVSQGSHVLRVRVAYVDTDGTTTYIDSSMAENSSSGPTAIYGPDGKRRSRLQPGVNIVRYKDGTVRKIQR